MASGAALLSLSDRKGLPLLAAALRSRGIRIVATTGTATAIRDLGIECEDVGDVTGFPALFDGRVKTLHPKIFAGILARRSEERDRADLDAYGIPSFSVVAVTLYPFEDAIARGGVTDAQAVERIDVGGVSLIRAAAKNFADVSVLVSPSQYGAFVESLSHGGPTIEDRRALAARAFARCEEYDAAIAGYFTRGSARVDATPGASLRFSMPRALELRYGENPWAQAAFYLDPSSAQTEQLSGKTLSYNNLLDVDACLRLLAPVDVPRGFPPEARSDRPIRAAIVKHTVPCGFAARASSGEALAAALGADPISAYGGIVACSGPIDLASAELLRSRFLEVVAAPDFDDAAAGLLAAKKNLRLLRFAAGMPKEIEEAPRFRSALGGVLVEYRDPAAAPDAWRLVSDRSPSAVEWRDLLFGFAAVRQVKSNAAVVVKDEVTLGVCGGQTNRVAAVELACRRASAGAKGAVLATDGYFPFADGLEAAAAAGIAAVVAPSGSIRDDEVVAAAKRAGISLVFASRRYFLH